MSRLEDELLDYENENGSNFTNNHLYSSVRYGLSALLAVQIVKRIVSIVPAYTSGSETFAFFLGLGITVLIYIWYFYYNLIQGNMERRGREILPQFRRPFLILFMLLNLTIIVLHFPYIIQMSISSIIIIICCAIILSREFQYFRMLS